FPQSRISSGAALEAASAHSHCSRTLIRITTKLNFMSPPWLEPRTAYVHIPFCGHHCGYCDFAVAAGQDHLIELYLDALAAELATLKAPQPVCTLFLGGGTPTY